MSNKLSTSGYESAVSDLSSSISNSAWDDEVKATYVGFIEEQKRIVSNIQWMADRAESVYHYVSSVELQKFKTTYSECLSKLQRLQRGN